LILLTAGNLKEYKAGVVFGDVVLTTKFHGSPLSGSDIIIEDIHGHNIMNPSFLIK
jgi:hypothetical protein